MRELRRRALIFLVPDLNVAIRSMALLMTNDVALGGRHGGIISTSGSFALSGGNGNRAGNPLHISFGSSLKLSFCAAGR